jgi:ATP-dependent RNA helicase RhlE
MTFAELDLIGPLQDVLKREGYKEATPIQAQSLPHTLSGRDLLGIAQTGTGKTAAFLLPILQALTTDRKPRYPKEARALVLTPTRELAAQVEQSARTYSAGLQIKTALVFGGVGQGPQVKALSKGVDVLVATPGRLLDLLSQGHVRLRGVEHFVLDEADRMLDMGFIHDVKRVVAELPKERQNLFFSATMPPPVAQLAKSILQDPVRVEVTPQATAVEKIEQRVLFVEDKDKEALLLRLLKEESLDKVLVFTRTKHRANKVAKVLSKEGVKTQAIHGNKSQTARTSALDGFRGGRVRVLVATDIAARGLDVDSISHVINFDMPNESESYVHRIGRTARAGADGTAYSFCSPDEKPYLVAIEKLTGQEIGNMLHAYHSERARNIDPKNSKPPHAKQGRHFKKRPGAKPKRHYNARRAR